MPSLDPDFDTIVHRLNQVLLRTEVAFRSLNTRMPQQQLNLLQIPARFSTQLGAGSSQVVRG
jgi:hypothetical protein